MEQLQAARQMAIDLGGTITDNAVGFITCFDNARTAETYMDNVNGDFDQITAEQQERCVVVVTIDSLI